MEIQQAATHRPSRYDQAVVHFERGDYECAAALLAQSLLENQTSSGWNDWATAKFLAGGLAEAEGGYRRALEMEPDNVQAVANLGALLAGQKRYSEAIPLLEFSIARSESGQHESTRKLLEVCKLDAARESLDKVGTANEMHGPWSILAKSLAGQTLSLDRVLFRQINFEADMRQFAEKTLKSIQEIHQRLVGGQNTTNRMIPMISLDQLCPEVPSVTLHSPNAVDGNISLYELIVINSLVRSFQPCGIFEIGTFDGRTTLNLAANLAQPGRVFTLDLPRTELKNTSLPLGDGDKLYIDKERSGARFVGTPQEKLITQLYGDSAKFDFGPYQGQIDFVFIDGSHAYDYVLNDSRKALGLLRDGVGTILWHDYPGWPGVTDALHELYLRDGAFAKLRNIEGTSFAILRVERT